MGQDLFTQFPEETKVASDLLGYAVDELCLADPHQRLNQTEYTQPALYVVNALTFWWRSKESGTKPDMVAGHSLGEYNALLAAGAFDFVTGLKLVQRRGSVMAQASGGGMLAVIGLGEDRIRDSLIGAGIDAVDMANFNSPKQIVISGPNEQLQAARSALENAGASLVVPLKVSAAFHSRHMQPAKAEFEQFLQEFQFSPPEVPVIANVDARPYAVDRIKENLCDQITHPVRWTETMVYVLRQPEPRIEEIGPGTVLTGLLRQIKAAAAT